MPAARTARTSSTPRAPRRHRPQTSPWRAAAACASPPCPWGRTWPPRPRSFPPPPPRPLATGGACARARRRRLYSARRRAPWAPHRSALMRPWRRQSSRTRTMAAAAAVLVLLAWAACWAAGRTAARTVRHTSTRSSTSRKMRAFGSTSLSRRRITADWSCAPSSTRATGRDGTRSRRRARARGGARGRRAPCAAAASSAGAAVVAHVAVAGQQEQQCGDDDRRRDRVQIQIDSVCKHSRFRRPACKLLSCGQPQPRLLKSDA